MPSRPRRIVLPLPKQWNRRVRSAVLHAISRVSLLCEGSQRLGLSVTYLAGRSHLPIVELKKAA